MKDISEEVNKFVDNIVQKVEEHLNEEEKLKRLSATPHLYIKYLAGERDIEDTFSFMREYAKMYGESIETQKLSEIEEKYKKKYKTMGYVPLQDFHKIMKYCAIQLATSMIAFENQYTERKSLEKLKKQAPKMKQFIEFIKFYLDEKAKSRKRLSYEVKKSTLKEFVGTERTADKYYKALKIFEKEEKKKNCQHNWMDSAFLAYTIVFDNYVEYMSYCEMDEEYKQFMAEYYESLEKDLLPKT